MVTETATIDGDYSPPMRGNPERLAWGILLISFAAFCAICVMSTLGAYYFLFQSSVSLDVQLAVGRGTIGIIEADGTRLAEDDRSRLNRNAGIRTSEQDRWSQTAITITDGREGGAQVATIILHNNSSMVFREASRPRFDWASENYVIEFSDLSGKVDVFVEDDLDRELVLRFVGINDERVRITSGGRYVIEASTVGMIVTNRDGDIVLVSADGANAFAVPSGDRVALNDAENNIERQQGYMNLITNGGLDVGGDALIMADNVPAFAWECTSGPASNLPIGVFREAMTPDDRLAYQLLRDNNADTNGSTRCIQDFGDGLDVTQYDYLGLQVMFSVAYQSLNGCGTEASECPMMVRINYKVASDQDTEVIEWLHGVYTQGLEPGQGSWKLQCGTCFQPHIEINDDVWYIYDSGNLFDAIPDDRQPAVLMQVEFFSEGHQYEVYFDEVALYAQSRDNLTEVGNADG